MKQMDESVIATYPIAKKIMESALIQAEDAEEK